GALAWDFLPSGVGPRWESTGQDAGAQTDRRGLLSQEHFGERAAHLLEGVAAQVVVRALNVVRRVAGEEAGAEVENGAALVVDAAAGQRQVVGQGAGRHGCRRPGGVVDGTAIDGGNVLV